MAKGQKLAVLVGCNYPGTKYELTGCINDVKAMQALLIGSLGFTEKNVTILTDPSIFNIIDALGKMFHNAKEGDILFFYFSGNGTLFTPSPGKKDRNEGIPAIVSSDLQALTAAHFRYFLEHRVPKGAIFTVVSDSSFSGGLFNEDNQIESNVPDPLPGLLLKTIPSGVIQSFSDVQAQLPAVSSKLSSGSSPSGNGILIGSSKPNEESVEVHPKGDPNGLQPLAYGAFTYDIPRLWNRPPFPPNTNWNVVTFARTVLAALGFNQNPFLFCTVENALQLFLGSG